MYVDIPQCSCNALKGIWRLDVPLQQHLCFKCKKSFSYLVQMRSRLTLWPIPCANLYQCNRSQCLPSSLVISDDQLTKKKIISDEVMTASRYASQNLDFSSYSFISYIFKSYTLPFILLRMNSTIRLFLKKKISIIIFIDFLSYKYKLVTIVSMSK